MNLRNVCIAVLVATWSACASLPPRAPLPRLRSAPAAARCVVYDFDDARAASDRQPVDQPSFLRTGDSDFPVPPPEYVTLRLLEALRTSGIFREVDRGGVGNGATAPAYRVTGRLVALEGDLGRTPRWTSCAQFLCTSWFSDLYPSSATGRAALDTVQVHGPEGETPLGSWQVDVRQEQGMQGWGRDRARNAADRALDEALRRFVGALNDALSAPAAKP